MKSSIAISRDAAPRERWLDSMARRVVHRTLSGLTRGKVTLVENGVRSEFGDSAATLSTTVRVTSSECYRRVLFGGTIGAGTGYMDGLWLADDLPVLIRIFAINEHSLSGLERGLAKLAQPFHRLYHFLRRNTRRGSRQNISEHYDLGNDFYRLFLDETMAYSCGIFEHEGTSLREASEAKFERICQKLRLVPVDHLLEIGTGWGGFAIYAAKHYGCRITTTTISAEQYAFARERVAAEGLSERVEVLKKDYRDLDGTYDKLVSIEMIEAVGDEYFDAFFAQCSRLLGPEGLMALQSITIADKEFERHRREVDFIKRYIFPGSCIPSVTVMLQSMTRACDLRLFELEDISRHYVTTLQTWRQSFWERIDSVREQGFSERFIRMWDFYLAYCEGGFAERYLGEVQMVLVKPDWRD